MNKHSSEVNKIARQSDITIVLEPNKDNLTKKSGATMVLPSHGVRYGQDVEINAVRYRVAKIQGKVATLDLCSPGPHGIQRGQHVTIDLVKYGLLKLTARRAKIELLLVKRRRSV